MTRPPKCLGPVKDPPPPVEDTGGAVHLKVWLRGISPTVWRRLLVPGACTLRELPGAIQVAVGWEGIHLYQFCLRARRLGSQEMSASSPDVALAALRLRWDARFVYEYDLNVPWRHELRVEGYLTAEPGKAYPRCTGGGGACPPEECGGPERYMAGPAWTRRCRWPRWRIWTPWSRSSARSCSTTGTRCWTTRRPAGGWRARLSAAGRASRPGGPFSRRSVNARLRRGEHLELMHQGC